jgi:hypothetical protein
MSYPHDDDFDGYRYGLTEAQIRAKMHHAIHGDEDEDDDIFDSFDELDESEDEDWD